MKENESVLSLIKDVEKKALLRDFPEYEKNPFIEPILDMKLRKKTVSISTTPQMCINETGEYVGDQYLIMKKKVDKQEFVKIFKNQMAIIFELSKTSQKILSYFINNLIMNTDYVIFDKKKAKLESMLSSDASIYAGLIELVQKKVIARSNLTSIYYINPAILFNGDRLIVVNAWLRDDKLNKSTLELSKENWDLSEEKQKAIEVK